MFIDSTYFRDEIRLSINTNQVEEFNNFITKIEKEVLISFLGYDLYKAFIEGLEAGSPEQKWLDLRDGCEYQVEDENGNDVYVQWIGLMNTEKKSMLAYFVYYFWMRLSQTTNTPSGEFKTVDENNVAPPNSLYNQKVVSAYNKGCDLYGVDLTCYSSSDWFIKGLDRPYAVDLNYYEEILKGSLYNMIYFANEASADTYPNWAFTSKDKINILGI